ncbi:MAG: GTP-binding protein, partial [Exiguobacterium sp.]|nr:GTP-binding protein [Exiguobacterium sp.]
MQIKKFTAKTMADAMAKVKQELGDEAVILNSRQVKTGWFGLFASKQVEVIAALEKEQVVTKPRQPAPVRTASTPTPSQPVITQTPPRVIGGAAPRLHASLQHVESLLSTESFADESWEETLNELYYTTKSVEEAERFVYEQVKSSFIEPPEAKRYVMVVGPTGVGKTTTLAKLAAHFKLTEGKTVGLITT